MIYFRAFRGLFLKCTQSMDDFFHHSLQLDWVDEFSIIHFRLMGLMNYSQMSSDFPRFPHFQHSHFQNLQINLWIIWCFQIFSPDFLQTGAPRQLCASPTTGEAGGRSAAGTALAIAAGEARRKATNGDLMGSPWGMQRHLGSEVRQLEGSKKDPSVLIRCSNQIFKYWRYF